MFLRNTWEKNGIFQHQYQRQVKMCIYLYLFHDWFHVKFLLIYSIFLIFIRVNQKKIKSSRKDYGMWTFDLWNTFSENYKPIRVLVWLVYKFTRSNCCLWLFSEFIQTQKRYPTSLDKISNLTWKLLVISSENFSCELNSLRTYSLQNISYHSLRL